MAQPRSHSHARRPGASCLLTPAVRLDEAQADAQLARFAKALGHPVRVQILRMLARKNAHQCCHIVDELPLAQSTVSEHLRILKSAGLVCANQSGPSAGYCIVPAALKQLKTLLAAL